MAVSTLAPDIRAAMQRRLHELELQKAQLGLQAPPQISTEIQDIRAQLGPAAPATFAESHMVLYDQVVALRDDVRRLYWLMPICMLLFCGLLILLVKL